MKKLKILYAGSPLASSFILKNLLELSKTENFEVVGVLTNPPAPQGRHKELIPTVCASVAESAGVPVFCPEHLDTAAREAISPLGADLLVCFDYGHIFGPKFLAMFSLGGINLHPSALPKYRGCTPVPAAILNGDAELGISVQKLALKTDEGDILASTSIKLTGTETTESLMDGPSTSSGTWVAEALEAPIPKAGFDLLKKIIIETANSGPFTLPPAKAQTGEASYTPFIKKEDGKIDWNDRAELIDRKLRAYTPWPGIFTMKGEESLKILKGYPLSDASRASASKVGAVAEALEAPATTEKPGTVLPYRKSIGIEILCGEGTVLVVTELQLQGKKPLDYKAFLNGVRDFIGCVLG